MNRRPPWHIAVPLFFLLIASFSIRAARAQMAVSAKTLPAEAQNQAPSICSACIRGHLEFLAGDALQGRGSGTRDEWLAASYAASQLRTYEVEPAGDNGGYLEEVTVVHQSLTRPPTLTFGSQDKSPAHNVTWTYGQQFVVLDLAQAEFSGPLQKVDGDAPTAKAQPGAVVFLTGKNTSKLGQLAWKLASQGAAAVLVPATAQQQEIWDELAEKNPELLPQLEGKLPNPKESLNILAVSGEAQTALQNAANGTPVHFKGIATAPQKTKTWNAIGIVHGQDPALQHSAVLLSAHIDHLGIGPPVHGDRIYNGADDDASGVAAVLEFARLLGSAQPKRPVIFALFGSEEVGELGSTYFSEHPPVPLHDIAAALEFEMIGRRDPALPDDSVWLSGWDRSDLGPQLAAHGANLVGDPHTGQGFFQRSDNFVLAEKGVIAQTISSFGLHSDYHQPSDDLAHLDFEHLDEAVASLIRPIEWLVNSDFRPQWKPGGKPEEEP